MRIAMTTLAFVLATGCGDAGFKGSAGKEKVDEPSGGKLRDGDGADSGDGDDTGESAGESGDATANGGKPDGGKDDAEKTPPPPKEDEGIPVADALQGNPDAEILGRCMLSMGLHKIPKEAVDNYKVLGSNSFAPFANNVITDEPDDEDHPVPSLVLVRVDGFGPVVNFDLEFMNPKGIYCVTGTAKSVFTNSKITICKEAKLGSDIQAQMGTLIANKRKIKC